MFRRAVVRLENTYDAPAEYVAAWLTDLRPDDGPRLFGMPGPARIERRGDKVFTEAPLPIGSTRGVVTLDGPLAWSARSEMYGKRGRLMARSRLRESVRPDGRGCVHSVEIVVEPASVMGRLMLPMMRVMMRRTLTRGFALARAEAEAAYRAGRAADG